ncbi:putative uncharacterized protein DDB_G0291608 [Bombina bombina]|uniref:putative uncharacterized protein DDB_G0291608 n=1 Tax=Bombina bombina TaxID=8345 RepID=UPI00235AF69E|nr:putative uncharacterized protein DDB_G0291608 [Bombina bombina]
MKENVVPLEADDGPSTSEHHPATPSLPLPCPIRRSSRHSCPAPSQTAPLAALPVFPVLLLPHLPKHQLHRPHLPYLCRPQLHRPHLPHMCRPQLHRPHLFHLCRPQMSRPHLPHLSVLHLSMPILPANPFSLILTFLSLCILFSFPATDVVTQHG